jgi:hypothetical protein
MDSLPFPVTTAIVAAMSVAAVALLWRIISDRWVWVVAICVPPAIASLVYWGPVLLRGGDTSEHSAWAILVIGIWSAVSIVTALLFVLLRRKIAGRTKHV